MPFLDIMFTNPTFELHKYYDNRSYYTIIDNVTTNEHNIL